jgi:hypothetical protein
MCPVLVLTGDGELLMGMGSLATVGLQKPGNLTIVVLANERYGETGGQVSHTTGTVDFVRGVALRPRSLSTTAEIYDFSLLIQYVKFFLPARIGQDRPGQSGARIGQSRRYFSGEPDPPEPRISADLSRTGLVRCSKFLDIFPR